MRSFCHWFHCFSRDMNQGSGASFQCKQQDFPKEGTVTPATQAIPQHCQPQHSGRVEPSDLLPPLSFLYNCTQAVRDFTLNTAQPNFNCKSIQDARRLLINSYFPLNRLSLLLKYSAIIESFAALTKSF